MVSVSRDTMTDVRIYDESGEYLATEHAQIALQYAYGTSAKRSIQMTKEAVSNLLYEVPIRSYVSLNVEGIAPIVDAMGRGYPYDSRRLHYDRSSVYARERAYIKRRTGRSVCPLSGSGGDRKQHAENGAAE